MMNLLQGTRPEFQSVVTEITPEIAVQLLKGNYDNRKVTPSKVKAYASDMIAGRWQVTTQGISVAKNGRIIDGQHRLMAVQRAGIPVKMVVNTNVPEENYNVFDIGIKRNNSTIFNIKDVRAAQVIGRIAINSGFSGADCSFGVLEPVMHVEAEIRQKTENMFSLIGAGKRRRFTNTNNWLALLWSIETGRCDTDWGVEVYQAMVKEKTEKFNDLCPVAHAVSRNLGKGHIHKNDDPFILHVATLYDQSNSNRTRYAITDELIAATRKEINGWCKVKYTKDLNLFTAQKKVDYV